MRNLKVSTKRKQGSAFIGSYPREVRMAVKDAIDQIKIKSLDILKKHGVKRAALFGSFARGEETEESDIDLLIEFEGRKSLLDLVALEFELQDLFGRKVDVVTYNSLHHLLKDEILSEQVVIL